MASGSRPQGVRGVSWREQETLDLISLWGEAEVQKALSRFHRNIDLFERIAAQMRQRGHNRTAQECRTKSKLLRKEYKRCVNHNSITGNHPKYCQYFELLDRIFSGDPAIQPHNLACSLRVRVVREGEEEDQEQATEGEGSPHQFVPVEETQEEEPLMLGQVDYPEGGSFVFTQQTNDDELGDQTLVTLNLVPLEQDERGEGATLSSDDAHGGLPARSSTPAPLAAHGSNTGPAAGRRTPTPTLPPSRSGTPVPSTSAGLVTTRAASRPTPAERIANARARKRRSSALTDVARELVRQGDRDHETNVSMQTQLLEMNQRMIDINQRMIDSFSDESSADRSVLERLIMGNMDIMRTSTQSMVNIEGLLERFVVTVENMAHGSDGPAPPSQRGGLPPADIMRQPEAEQGPATEDQRRLEQAPQEAENDDNLHGDPPSRPPRVRRLGAGKGRKRMDL